MGQPIGAVSLLNGAGRHRSRKMETLFQFLNDYTLRNVLLGTAWIGVVSGSLGTFAFLRRQSLLGDVISHATLPGVVLAFLVWQRREIGILMAGAAGTGLLATALIQVVDTRTNIKRDGAMGVALAVFFGIGVLLLSMTQNLPTASKAGLDKFIFGQAAALVQSDVNALLAAGVVVLGALLVFWRELKIITFDPDFARAAGFRVVALEGGVVTLIVVTTVMGLQTVGVILMSAMLIAPAAAARQWTDRLSSMVLIAALIGGASGGAGAVVSAFGPQIPTGPVVVLALTAAVLVSLGLGRKRGLVWRWRRQRSNRMLADQDTVLRAMVALEAEHEVAGRGHPEAVVRMAVGQSAQVGQALNALRDTGLADLHDNGYWSLTERGRAEAMRHAQGQRG